MSDIGQRDLIQQYNYDSFVPEKFERWMRFDISPPLGQRVPDFPLWSAEDEETRLHGILGENLYTIVEFGSFT